MKNLTPPQNARHDAPDRAQKPVATTAELIRRLHEGQLDGAKLTVAQRRACVEHLTTAALTNAEIAEVMGISESTVTRDRAAARAERGIEPDPKLGDQMLGELERLASASIARLTRLAGDTTINQYARLWAEESMIRIYQRLVDTARRMHYIDTGTGRLAEARQAQPDYFEKLHQQVQRRLKALAPKRP
jgi:transposase